MMMLGSRNSNIFLKKINQFFGVITIRKMLIANSYYLVNSIVDFLQIQTIPSQIYNEQISSTVLIKSCRLRIRKWFRKRYTTIDQFILAKNISNKRIRETLTFAIFNFLKSDLVTTLDNYSYACV